MNKYLLESITAAILLLSNTIGKTLQEILLTDKNLSYGRQLELYSHLDFWNWFLNKHSAEIYTPPDSEYLNHQIHIWIAVHQAIETPFETEEESYQTAPVFDFLSSKSDSSTQTVTPEPMANNSMQANILATLQSIQTALERRNNTLLSLFRDNAQDSIEWLDDFKRAVTANQYDKEYKFQIIGGYLQNSFAIWFSQKTNTNA
ncbi:hypothetical protein G9A89_011136 [Geosiphon pyriformis]|nr:hypothetical protein G9A89_011136 [Geosiphon pyriformis]